MFHRRTTVGALAALMFALGMTARAAEPAPTAGKTTGDAYPLDYCVVSGAKLGSRGEPVKYDFKGREIKFCCPKCAPEFEKNPAGYIAKLDSAIVEQQMPYYPLSTCVVSNEKLGGEMGKPVNKVYNNRLVRFCCNMCPKDFEKDPQKYLSKLDSAVIAQQKPTYPLETCVVSGKKLGTMGTPVDYVQGNRLVRFCCSGCIADFKGNPTAYLSKIDAAMKAKTQPAKDEKALPKKSG